MPFPQIDRSLQTDLCLLLLSEEKDPNVRRRVARALGRFGDRSRLPQLKQAIKQEQDADVLGVIRDAIAKLEA